MISKRQLNLFFQRRFHFSWLYSFAVKLNLVLFHWSERSHWVKFGKDDEDKKYYVIRSRGKTEGLLSSALYVAREIEWARTNDFVPFVNFSDSTCQYHVERMVNGTNNAWEYFFMQPENLTLNEIKNKRNVLLSGWKLFEKNHDGAISNEHLKFQPYILSIVENYWNKNFKNKKVLGVFIRGTDYVSLKPKGHSVQPSINSVQNKITEYNQKYNFDKIYVVTEDYDYYKILSAAFAGKVCSFGDNFIKDYKGNDYLSESFKDDPYERGLNYLIRIILLSKCEYTICSKASGSEFAEFIRKESPVDEYWFELGVY